MRSRHIAMSFAEFRLLPRDSGWKYEYFDDEAHISPRQRLATVRVEVASRPLETPLLDMLIVRPRWHRRGLATALVSWSLRELLAAGEATLRSLPAGERAEPGTAAALWLHL